MGKIKNITVFSTTTCAYCPMVKRWLQHKGYDYEEVILDHDSSRQQEMIQKSGQFGVPVIDINGEDSWNGLELALQENFAAPARHPVYADFCR